jgi:hypothetical protein
VGYSRRFVPLIAGSSSRLIPAVFGLSLAVYWLAYLQSTPPTTFADSTRYLHAESGWSLVSEIDRHQGAFLPVALFQATGSARGVFAVNSFAWIVSWTLLCAAVSQRLEARAAAVTSLGLLVMATTSQVVGWHGAVLTESLTVSLAIIVIAAIIFASAPAARPRSAWGIILTMILLLLTKPLVALALAPAAMVAIGRSSLTMRVRLCALAILSGTLVGIPAYAATLPYGEGLTYTGWYALTRAVRFSTDPALAPATTLPIRSCAALSAGIDQSVERGFGLGLIPEVYEALGKCPAQVRWLNRDAPGPLSLLVREPGPTLKALAGGLVWLAKPIVYPSFLLGMGTWGEGRVHSWLTPREPGPYLAVILAALTLSAMRGRRAFATLCVTLFAGVIAVAAFAMFVDAVEQGRHVSAFNVMSLTTVMLLLPSSSSLREG